MNTPTPKTIKPKWQRSYCLAAGSVDRDKGVLRGYVVAQEGDFKTPGRGSFDLESLRAVTRLMNSTPKGVKSHFAHPTLSDDGLGKLLGRARNARMDKDRVRADLHFNSRAFNGPRGEDYAGYIMDLAEDDPDALSSSLVLEADLDYKMDKKGKILRDEAGNELPPVWRPTAIYGSDIVDTGDAVDGLLSSDGLPDAVVRRGYELLIQQFGVQPDDVVRARIESWLDRALAYRRDQQNVRWLHLARERERRAAEALARLHIA